MKLRYVFAAICSLVLTIGCAKSQSGAIATSEIYISAYVEGDSSSSVTCYVSLRVGGGLGTYLELSGSDELYCGDGTHTVAMAKTTDLLGIVEYSVSSGLTYNPGATYTVTFKRSASESHASTAVLPAAVAITAPTAGASHTKNTALGVTWTAGTSEGVRLGLSWVSGGTSSSLERTDSDDGSYTFIAADTQTLDTNNTNVSGNVMGTVSVTRYVSGTAATTVKGGSIEARQKKTVAITLVD